MASQQAKDNNNNQGTSADISLMKTQTKINTLPASLPALDEFIEKQHIRKTIMEEMMDNQPTFDHYLEKIKTNNHDMMFPPVVMNKQMLGT
jgi:hypothetical protein